MSKGEIVKFSNGRMIPGYNAMSIELDVTALGALIKDNPDMVSEFQTKDGTTHKKVKLSVWENKPENQSKFGTHYVKIEPPYKAESKVNNETIPF